MRAVATGSLLFYCTDKYSIMAIGPWNVEKSGYFGFAFGLFLVSPLSARGRTGTGCALPGCFSAFQQTCVLILMWGVGRVLKGNDMSDNTYLQMRGDPRRRGRCSPICRSIILTKVASDVPTPGAAPRGVIQ